MLERGVVWADAGIRGGGEFGQVWRHAGRVLHKKNSFTDFADCARALVTRGWAPSADRVALKGGSAGGLLVCATGIVFNPEVCGCVSASVPFVDVVTTMMDESIPLTVEEFLEWGNYKIKAEYDNMLSYSPVDFVTNLPESHTIVFPNVFLEGAFEDARVQYFEPAALGALLREKWAASERAGRVLANVCYLDAGHAGASGRFSSLQQLAKEYAFILGSLKVKV